MTQRRVDLAVMEDYELRNLLSRFKSLQRIANEMGADERTMASWSQFVSDVEAEIAFRIQEDGPVPF